MTDRYLYRYVAPRVRDGPINVPCVVRACQNCGEKVWVSRELAASADRADRLWCTSCVIIRGLPN